ncbi:FAD-binding protein [Pseudomonas aeruginosa]
MARPPVPACRRRPYRPRAAAHPVPGQPEEWHPFLNEWYAVDLVKNQDGAVVGIIAICIETGETVYIRSKAAVLATGGAGRIYASTTNALINTGDGVGMALRAGVPVRTSRCGSSTRPASPAPVYWSPKAAAAKAVT